MKRIGMVGLGTMGAPLARTLLKAGYELTFFARRGEVIEQFQAAGATAVARPAEVTERADLLLTIVTADADLEEVVLGEQGFAAGELAGKLLVDMSTVSPNTARRLGAALGRRGAAMLDAPVSGGPWGAGSGTLTIMVGGSDEDFQRALTVLEVLGSHVFHVGPLGSGQTVKLANQLMAGSIMALIGEAFSLAAAQGVDLERLADVVEVSSGNSAVFGARGRKFVLANEYPPAFRLDLMRKDLLLAIELAQQVAAPTPVAAAALQQFTSALHDNLAHEDFAAVVKVSERTAGVRFREGEPG